ncbi:MAG: hypothetical protein F4089_03005 [Gammaproteobacteria bacterium]|nr:hypothetical protein [Gammaproteobacteria bacterium]
MWRRKRGGCLPDVKHGVRRRLYEAEPVCSVLFSALVEICWIAQRMWHLIEDFFEQGVVVKLFLAVGWLAVVIMIASLIELLLF